MNIKRKLKYIKRGLFRSFPLKVGTYETTTSNNVKLSDLTVTETGVEDSGMGKLSKPEISSLIRLYIEHRIKITLK